MEKTDFFVFECSPRGDYEREDGRFCSGGCRIMIPVVGDFTISKFDFPSDCILNDIESACNFNNQNLPRWELINIKKKDETK